MIEIKGNIIQLALEGYFDVIVHGCNCFNTMGAGLALQIRNNFPEAYQADQRTGLGDKYKLGSFTRAEIVRPNTRFDVVNAYTQYRYGKGGPHVNYLAIFDVFTKIAHHYNGKRIAYPKIGCGLAGGEWNKVVPIIETALTGQNHTLVVTT
jgi:O-acetyl-ADP-ribose deacetylase (regulator of RNase III)